MCLNNLSGCDLIALSSSLSIILGENLSADETAILASFVTSLGDNLAILATKKAAENSNRF